MTEYRLSAGNRSRRMHPLFRIHPLFIDLYLSGPEDASDPAQGRPAKRRRERRCALRRRLAGLPRLPPPSWPARHGG